MLNDDSQVSCACERNDFQIQPKKGWSSQLLNPISYNEVITYLIHFGYLL